MANNNIPVQTPAERYNNANATPPVRFPQSPRLTPNTGQNVPASFGMNKLASQYDYLNTFPRTAATATATVGGTVSSGNVSTITVTNPALPGGSFTASYTAGASDGVDQVAEGLASAINSNVNAQSLGIFASTAEAVITVNHPGPVGNLTVLTKTVQGSVTITLSNSGDLSGGAGAVIPYEGATFNYAGINYHLNAGEPREFTQALVNVLVNSGAPIV